MLRKIIHIDEEKCNGCGACARACHESAIGMVNDKAKLLRDDYCDGMGDCLPNCPTGAITFEYREAAAYDEAAVKANQMKKQQSVPAAFSGCPGSKMQTMNRNRADIPGEPTATEASELSQWPVQIKLISPRAPYFEDADLLIAADCTAYAYASFHRDFIRGRVTLIGCPKLDAIDYSEKLTDILRLHTVRSILLVRMEVPCCGGLEYAAQRAVEASGKDVPLRVITVGIDGKLI